MHVTNVLDIDKVIEIYAYVQSAYIPYTHSLFSVHVCLHRKDRERENETMCIATAASIYSL